MLKQFQLKIKLRHILPTTVFFSLQCQSITATAVGKPDIRRGRRVTRVVGTSAKDSVIHGLPVAGGQDGAKQALHALPVSLSGREVTAPVLRLQENDRRRPRTEAHDR